RAGSSKALAAALDGDFSIVRERKGTKPMDYRDASSRLAQYRNEIAALRKKMREIQASHEPEEVKDYEFATGKGPVRLSQLFGGKDYLFVIHNMDAGCPYCTLWPDGFNGFLPHIEDRAAFVL